MTTMMIQPLFIGTTELLLIGGIALLMFGGKKLPEMMRGLGQGVKEFKKGVNEDTPPKEEEDDDKSIESDHRKTEWPGLKRTSRTTEFQRRRLSAQGRQPVDRAAQSHTQPGLQCLQG